MQLTSALYYVLALAPAAISAAPIQTCSEQGECISFTMNKVNVAQCSGDACEYEVCMELKYDGNCAKEDTVSHTCEKADEFCTVGEGFSGAAEIGGIDNGYKSCHIVPPGGVAEFLLKDGNAKGGCGAFTKSSNGIDAACETFGELSCTGKGNVGKECVWRVQAPLACGNLAGGGGDPHIKKWDGHRFFYHGECDLLLLQSKEFGDNTGLDLQIRTTIKDFYSFIEAAALRIGDSVLEISSDHLFIDGVELSDDDLPATVGGYTLNSPYQDKRAMVYRVDLNNGDHILFRSYKFFLSIDVSGEQDDFENSVGLLGDYHTGAMTARDGETLLEDPDDFGGEWQVRGDEPMLFREVRAPQLPHATCNMPSTTERRQLQNEVSAVALHEAEDACSGKCNKDFEFCVSDVLATGDLGMAGAW